MHSNSAVGRDPDQFIMSMVPHCARDVGRGVTVKWGCGEVRCGAARYGVSMGVRAV